MKSGGGAIGHKSTSHGSVHASETPARLLLYLVARRWRGGSAAAAALWCAAAVGRTTVGCLLFTSGAKRL